MGRLTRLVVSGFPHYITQIGFYKREPWFTQVIINGRSYGGNWNVCEDVRIKQFFDNFPDARKILDLGCLEGGHTVQFAHRLGAYVVGIEGRKDNIERANFIKRILKIRNVKFLYGNLEVMDLSLLGKFDAVFCSGLLYHLPEPWKLIKQIRNITSNLFLWTHYVNEDKSNEICNGFRGRWNRENVTENLSGLSPKSFWLTLQSLRDMLKIYDFSTIRVIDDNPKHQNGPCVTISAQAD